MARSRRALKGSSVFLSEILYWPEALENHLLFWAEMHLTFVEPTAGIQIRGPFPYGWYFNAIIIIINKTWQNNFCHPSFVNTFLHPRSRLWIWNIPILPPGILHCMLSILPGRYVLTPRLRYKLDDSQSWPPLNTRVFAWATNESMAHEPLEEISESLEQKLRSPEYWEHILMWVEGLPGSTDSSPWMRSATRRGPPKHRKREGPLPLGYKNK